MMLLVSIMQLVNALMTFVDRGFLYYEAKNILLIFYGLIRLIDKAIAKIAGFRYSDNCTITWCHLAY